MVVNKALEQIKAGDASAEDARKVIGEFLETADATRANILYAALRGWTWKALLTRRFDSEMDVWFRLLRNTAARLSKRDDKTAAYVEALSHLVDESLRYGASHTRAQLLTRSHLGELLEVVRRNNGRADRSLIEATMGLTNSRLSQLLTELTVAGALNREADGKRARFVLTDEGRELLDLRPPSPEQEERKAEAEALEVERYAAIVRQYAVAGAREADELPATAYKLGYKVQDRGKREMHTKDFDLKAYCLKDEEIAALWKPDLPPFGLPAINENSQTWADVKVRA